MDDHFYSDKLIEKAKKALEEQISESSVLYALVQLNKAAEDRERKLEFPSISFYRCWLVHNNLDYHSGLEDFFQKWDEILKGIQAGIGRAEATKKTAEVINLANLLEELSQFGVTFPDHKKSVFIDALINGLVDVPIRRSGKQLKEFRFTFDQERKNQRPSYVCHMQVQHTNGTWLNGPEIHIPGES